MLRKDAHGFCNELCCFQQPKSGAVNDIRQMPKSFTIVFMNTAQIGD